VLPGVFGAGQICADTVEGFPERQTKADKDSKPSHGTSKLGDVDQLLDLSEPPYPSLYNNNSNYPARLLG
jgi:hypothetical protein